MYETDANVRQNVLDSFRKTKEAANEDVQEIKRWIAVQRDFPEIMEDRMVLNFLQLNKFDTEKTKKRIASYYTLREEMPRFFVNNNPKSPKLQRVFETAYVSNHPTALGGVSRVFFLKPKKPNTFCPQDVGKIFFSTFEMRLLDDCMVNDVIIVDMEHMTLGDVLQVTPKLSWEAFRVYQRVFALRMRALHIINSSVFTSLWMIIFKLVLKQKMVQRINVHRGAEVLKEIFPQEALPRDYGGEGPSLEELNEMMKRKLAMHQDRFDKLDSFRVVKGGTAARES